MLRFPAGLGLNITVYRYIKSWHNDLSVINLNELESTGKVYVILIPIYLPI